LQLADEGWSLHAATDRHVLDLQMRPLSPAVLNGEAGLSRKSDQPGAASYYYSVPRAALSGRVTADGESCQAHGMAWLDREWGSGALASNQTGWDWFALQLDDGSALMFYSLRRDDGSRDPYSAGTWVDPHGEVRHLAHDDLQIEVLKQWTSPRGGRYPAQWRLQSAVLSLDLSVRPLLADQELLTRPRYWEGAVESVGRREGRELRGRGYVELVGYAAAN
jgi:predicted secreted hydrolase